MILQQNVLVDGKSCTDEWRVLVFKHIGNYFQTLELVIGQIYCFSTFTNESETPREGLEVNGTLKNCEAEAADIADNVSVFLLPGGLRFGKSFYYVD